MTYNTDFRMPEGTPQPFDQVALLLREGKISINATETCPGHLLGNNILNDFFRTYPTYVITRGF